MQIIITFIAFIQVYTVYLKALALRPNLAALASTWMPWPGWCR